MVSKKGQKSNQIMLQSPFYSNRSKAAESDIEAS
jgi:hypothetical protein